MTTFIVEFSKALTKKREGATSRRLRSDRATRPLIGVALSAALLIGLVAGKVPAASVNPIQMDPRLHLDPAVMISVAQVREALAGEKRPLLVDVRHKRDFAAFKIPGAINLPLHALKTKTFLKGRPVVLIHEGYRYALYLAEVRRLNSAGFDIRILTGGLNEWRLKGGELVGDVFAQKTLCLMPPSAFFSEQYVSQWVPVDISSGPSRAEQAIAAHHVPFEKMPDVKPSFDEGKKQRIVVAADFFKALSRLRKEKNDPLMSFLFFNADGENYDPVRRYVEMAGVERVFFLEGGVEAYQQFLDDMQLARKPKEQRVQSTTGCPVCTE